MRQLGRHGLEDEPGRHDPGEQEGDRVLAPLGDQANGAAMAARIAPGQKVAKKATR